MQTKLRCGYTTGSCAAAAAKAALTMLLSEKNEDHVSIDTPSGISLTLTVEEAEVEKGQSVRCAVRKDGGDDPDVTHGILIAAKVSFSKESAGNIRIDGGIGVGRVTQKGLEQPVGSAAINSVPRQMIKKELLEVLSFHACDRGINVVIEVPEGERIAEKTFNKRLGILGGISILGTSGIVVPMSEQALVDTIRVEMKQKLTFYGSCLIAAPGNYGSHFCVKTLGILEDEILLCSNFIGKTLDMAAEMNVKKLLLIGHIGKFVKLAGGIMDTHSSMADCRAEIMAANSALCGASLSLVQRIARSNTTQEALDMLREENLIGKVCNRLVDQILFYLLQRSQEGLETGVILFSNQDGLLSKSKNADALLYAFQEQKRGGDT